MDTISKICIVITGTLNLIACYYGIEALIAVHRIHLMLEKM